MNDLRIILCFGLLVCLTLGFLGLVRSTMPDTCLEYSSESFIARWEGSTFDEADFHYDYPVFFNACRDGIVDFGALPKSVKLVCLSVAYTVGSAGFHRFVHFRDALSQRDYPRAARELENSLWATQVGKARLADHEERLMQEIQP